MSLSITPASRASAKSRVIVASGPIIRSTEEWEMSRSCQSATSSSAGDHRRAHHAGEAGEIFGQHRIALVRHRRRALLAFGEELLGFQHLGALQMTDLGRQPLDRRGDDGERSEDRPRAGRAGLPGSRSARPSGRASPRRKPQPLGRCWRRCRRRRKSPRSRFPRAPRRAAPWRAKTRHKPRRA